MFGNIQMSDMLGPRPVLIYVRSSDELRCWESGLWAPYCLHV